ncbi:MAG: hypothetical protein KJ737_25220 [Proteobacteria bacterium]|nr:hypothetical protein [Pseudomonadota bacterium]
MTTLTPRVKQAKVIWAIIALSYITVWIIPLTCRFDGVGEGTKAARSILRDYTQFKWYVIPFLLVVLNFFFDEVRRKNWAGILAGLSLFLMDVFNEIWNGLFYTATGGYAAVWMCQYPTAYQPLMGWNIEIIFMFLMMGIASTKLLPEDKDMMIFGKINNRHFIAFIMAWICVVVEIILNMCGALTWNYWWWQADFPWLIFLIGYLPFWEISYFVYDLPDVRSQIRFVGLMAAILFIALVIFIPLGWV